MVDAQAPEVVTDEIAAIGKRLTTAIEQAVVGKPAAVELALAALLADQHLLIEDVPGVGKTTLAKAVARAAGCSFSRIQFTPDLLPGDITGSMAYSADRGFYFEPGPLFGQLVLADEINRASPKTQSALLEAMEERQVTADRQSHPLPSPFIVMATKNPIEHEGTYALPEAQVDRFGLLLSLGYPERNVERSLVEERAARAGVEEVDVVLSAADVLRLQVEVRQVHLHPDVADYIVQLLRATRRHSLVQVGASPRAGLALRDLARALAALRGRSHVRPDDIQELAVPVLAHRLVLKPEAGWEAEGAATLVAEVLERLPAPAAPRW